MLTNTFCHIPTVGAGTERKLWEAGVHDWSAFRSAGELPISQAKRDLGAKILDESAAHLEREDPRYFHDRLPSNQSWRLFGQFRAHAAYLDIETTGLGGGHDHVTTIALFDGRSIFTYVHGRNLDDFAHDVRNYRLLVTYNGKQFDLPFLRDSLGVDLQQAHIDLRFVLANLGYRGGLKGCEHSLGLSRGELEGVNGYFAVLLWQDFLRRKNAAALETLLAYNVEDVVNLETLMVLAYNMKLKGTPFAGTHELERPERPTIPFKPDMETVNRIRKAYHFI